MTTSARRVPLASKLARERAALVVIDMCNDFLHPQGKTAQRAGRPIEAARTVVPVIAQLIAAARAGGVPVFHAQHTTLPRGLSDSGPWADARSRAAYSVPDICLAGTWGQRIVDELAPASGEPVVRKYRYSAFAGTELDLLLRTARRETVVCCGVSTNSCVEATAREAFSHEYYVVIPRDGCASWERSLHEATLATAAARYAEVVSAAEVVTAWNPAGGR